MAPLFRPVLGVIGAVVLLAELSVLAMGILRPHVSEAYYDFYISRTRSCFMPPDMTQLAERNLQEAQINVARLDQPTACYLLRSGWANVETWGVWSLGKQASIELPITPGQLAIRLTFRGFSKDNRQSVKIYIGDKFSGQYAVPNAISTNIRLVAPPGGGTIIISFQIAEPTAPASVLKSSGDTRKIGIGLIAITRNRQAVLF